MSAIKVKNEKGEFVDISIIKGENGATFIPAVSENGDLSWSNDKGEKNPKTVNIKGPKGDTGQAGIDGKNGADGTSVSCIKVTNEEEAIAQSTKNPNNIYYW